MTRRKNSPQPPRNRDAWCEELSRTLVEQRQRVTEFLALQRERLGRLEAALAVEIRQQREESAPPEEARNANSPRNAERRSAAPAVAEAGLDWEAEKRRILAALETEDQAPETEAEAAAWQKIEEIVRTTDQVLAEKDREIGQIKQVLQEQSNNLQGVAVGAAALETVLNQDPLICEQRANLQQLQQQWWNGRSWPESGSRSRTKSAPTRRSWPLPPTARQPLQGRPGGVGSPVWGLRKATQNRRSRREAIAERHADLAPDCTFIGQDVPGL